MIVTLHRLTSWLFYLLGICFFGAYLLHSNDMGNGWPKWFMESTDITFAIVALLYGGTSLYRSTVPDGRRSMFAYIIIGIPLIALAGFLIALNFWDVF